MWGSLRHGRPASARRNESKEQYGDGYQDSDSTDSSNCHGNLLLIFSALRICRRRFGRVKKVFLSHWMCTLVQPRTKIKNLVGGLLVLWEVVDFRQLIAQSYRLPVPFVQIPSVINCASFGSESANGSHPQPTPGGKVRGLRSGSAGPGGSQGRHEAEARRPTLPGIAGTVGTSPGNRYSRGTSRAHLAGKCIR